MIKLPTQEEARAERDVRAPVALAIKEGNGDTVPCASAGPAFLSAMLGDAAVCVADLAVAFESAQRGGNSMALSAACAARIWAGLVTGNHAEITDGAHGMLRIGETRGLGVELPAQLVLATVHLATATAVGDPAGAGAARSDILAADEALAAAEAVREAIDIRICDRRACCARMPSERSPRVMI